MRYRFHICDVFTDTRFGGNQLAVFPEAAGLSDQEMQHLAREFNFSETSFVLPAEQGHTRRVRIFTPTREIPFAGHPNVGTAFTLVAAGEIELPGERLRVVFEEGAGLVAIEIQRRQAGAIWCELAAPQGLSLGRTVSFAQAAAAVSLPVEDLITTHAPQEASVGMPFLMVEVKDRAALGRAQVDVAAMKLLSAQDVTADVHLFTRVDDGVFDLQARMFAPLDGIPEDPATGSANCALAGLLALRNSDADGSYAWRIAQGVEMGRPSVLEARATKRGSQVTGTWIGGCSVMMANGHVEV
jgi:trans-2,3-dihydro-3-hydroxyanthranilate isomerase